MNEWVCSLVLLEAELNYKNTNIPSMPELLMIEILIMKLKKHVEDMYHQQIQ